MKKLEFYSKQDKKTVKEFKKTLSEDELVEFKKLRTKYICRQRYLRKREELLKKQKTWRENNKEHARKYGLEYSAQKRKEKEERRKQWELENPEIVKMLKEKEAKEKEAKEKAFKEKGRTRAAELYKTKERKAYQKEYYKRPEVIARRKEKYKLNKLKTKN